MKMTDNYQVVFEGDLQEGFDVKLIKFRLGRKFGLAQEQVDRLITRNRHVLGDQFDFHCAKNMKEVIECLGLKVRIECYSPGKRGKRRGKKLALRPGKPAEKRMLQ